MPRPGPDPAEPEGAPTHAMMIAALNQILGECGYPPVPAEPADEPAAPDPADRLVAEARQRADGIVAAARQTALEYTDAALRQAARTVHSARRTFAYLPAAPLEPATVPPVAAAGAGPGWLAAARAAGVYLPIGEQAAARALSAYLDRLRTAARTGPPDLDAGYRIGVEVVALGIGRPEALPATMVVVLDHLGAGETLGRAAREVAGAFAAGFAAALQARTLAQQESLHRATQRAAEEFRATLEHSEARYRPAHYDPVTGLATRSALVQRLRQAANAAGPGRHLGLCLVDLGGLGVVEDHVLTEAGRRLLTLAGHPDHLLARYGPAALALLVHDSGGPAHLAEVAERAARALASLPGTGPTAAVGAVDVPAAGLDVARLLVDAEIAVRQARTAPAGWAVLDPPPAGPPGPATSVSGLVTGPPSYQPIVRPDTGRVAGLHVRMHWRHPHLGSLDLGRIARLTGDRETTTRLAAGLLAQSCRQAMSWDGSRQGPFLGLDLPVHRIGYPDVVDLVHTALTTSGLPPARLHLHLSGLDAVPAGEHSPAVLAALAALGVRLELDDFGTGAVSLAYLRELPVHGLRTPAGLVHPSAAGPDADRDLVTGLVRVAHALGLTLTVHGADDDQVVTRLTGTGVDRAQGLRYGAPATPHQVPALLRRPALVAARPDRRAAS